MFATIEWIEILKVILLGIVEGITEWLPVSSTGHMILVEEFWPLKQSESFVEMFNVVIQLGAILAVFTVFFQKLNPFSKAKTAQQKKDTYTLWGKVIVSCIPAAVIGLLFDDWFDAHFYNAYVVSAMLIVYGILFILIERWHRGKQFAITDIASLSYSVAIGIGLFQILALIPGTSRSGATIIGAMLLGCSRSVAAEFTFYLAIPVMAGASALKVVKYLFVDQQSFAAPELIYLLLGTAVAYVISIFAIRFLMDFVKKHDFKVFGYYRIVLAIVVLCAMFAIG